MEWMLMQSSKADTDDQAQTGKQYRSWIELIKKTKKFIGELGHECYCELVLYKLFIITDF